MMTKTTKITIVFMTLMVVFAGGVVATNSITVQGSDTLLEMVAVEAGEYMKIHSQSSIQVTGGGSGTGIAALLNGTVDVANASRKIKKKERRKITKDGGKVFEVAIALDGITVYLNVKNSVSDLSMNQLRDIYLGKIDNWKEVGGSDAKIIRYSRENNSGTYVFFKKKVLNRKQYAPDCQNLPGTASVVHAVSKDKNGIGFGGISYGEGIKFARINGVVPSAKTISAGEYPISRNLYQYTINKPEGLSKKFIAFELSKIGQQLAEKAGYIPLSESQRKESLAMLN
tara:strand:- start:27807 stop:28661 length:855 start_codon:yes stop_codon:yes gene_type:complete